MRGSEGGRPVRQALTLGKERTAHFRKDAFPVGLLKRNLLMEEVQWSYTRREDSDASHLR